MGVFSVARETRLAPHFSQVEIVARASSAIGIGVAYSMDSGAHDPSATSPAGDDGACDCSAFACWALGTRKYRPDLAQLRTFNGGWLNTDGMWHLARAGLLFVEAPPEPGGIIVYPSARTAHGASAPHVGHVGIISEVDGGKVARAVHCSHGNYGMTGDAIQETGPAVFTRWRATLVARYAPETTEPAASAQETP